MSQVERNWDDELISEVAVKCNDPFFRDFRKDIYAQAVFREQRMLAQKYNVLERRWSSYVGEENLNVPTKWGELVLNEIPLTMTDFSSEFEVLLNNVAFAKRNKIDQLTANTYYIRYTKDDADLRELEQITVGGEEGEYLIEESDDDVEAADPRVNFNNDYSYVIYLCSENIIAKDDFIFVYYISTGRLANETTGKPVLPVKFYEELLRKSILYIAKLGIASFAGEKKIKYRDIYGIHGAEDRRGSKSELQRNDEWVKVKPFKMY